MIIDNNEEKIDVCCYEMMDQLLRMGINFDWQTCPFCGEPIQYIVEE
jgi:hypothetical protein